MCMYIIFSYFYPKQLLSQQFWHPDQKKMFILEEYEKRSQYYLPLVKEVAVTCKEIHNKALFRLSFKVLFILLKCVAKNLCKEVFSSLNAITAAY